MDIGDTLGFTSTLRDKPQEQGGVLVNAVSAALTITLPDGTTATPAVPAPTTTGNYAVDYMPTQSGRFVGVWLFTMSGGKTTSYVETFDVGSCLVTVDEAIAHLRANGIITSSNDLEQLQWLCFVATDAVERDLGRAMTTRTVTEIHNGGVGSIVLRKTPVVSITTLTEGGATVLGTTGYVLETLADGGGILYRGSTMVPQRFWWGRSNIVVTYVTGYTDPPRIVRKVALNTIQAMWESSQQAEHPFLDEGNADSFTGQGSALLSPVEMSAYESLRVHG